MKTVPHTTERFECKDGSSDKFWQLTSLEDGTFLAEWGKNGHGPQGSKVYSSIEAAAKRNEKVAKGYKRVEAKGTSEVVEIKPKTKPEPAEDGSNFMELLRKI